MPYIYPSINLIETILSDYGIIKSGELLSWRKDRTVVNKFALKVISI